MPVHRVKRLQVLLAAASAALLVLAFALSGCEPRASAEPAPAGPDQAAPSQASVVLAQREGKMRDYPCSRCHSYIARSTDPSALGRGPHGGLRVKHFEAAEQCDVCHDVGDMNRLRLLGGAKVGFNDSQQLCGQCHAEKLRDWDIGAHGKHIGSWQKNRYRLTCADCHDPHTPRFPGTVARPAPPFPERGIPKGAH